MEEWNDVRKHPLRFLIVLLAVGGLVIIYLIQESLAPNVFFANPISEELNFSIKKILRVLLNDTCMLLLVYAWFKDRNITRLALWVQAIDVLVLVPIYLLIKLSLEGPSEISNPMLSQWHRLLVNPTLMILLIPAIYYQRHIQSIRSNS